MADHTTRLNLYLPGGGSSGTITPDEPVDIDKINDNMKLLDAAIGFRVVTTGTRPSDPFIGQPIKETDTGDIRYWDGDSWEQLSGVPVGTISLWPVSAIPAGSLKCDGSSLLRASYPALYALIGTSYGLGTDITTSTTFALPDFSGRTAVGPGQVKNKQTGAQSGINVAGNTFTIPGATLGEYVDGQGVRLSSSGVMPTGLSAGTIYYVGVVSAGVLNFSVSRSSRRQGVAVDITAQGTGNLTVEMVDDFTPALARTYGASAIQLHPQQIPAHQHTGRWVNQNVNDGPGNRWVTATGQGYSSEDLIGPSGSDAVHGNVSPSLGMNYIIRALA